MATKTVTLKGSNGDTLYPVTDSNVVNINQQKTLAQALDGVVYAEDPTQSATPTAWVTGSDIDWASLASTPWQSGTYASGFKASTNAGFSSYGIGACIYAGFLYIRFSASRSSGDFAASTEYTIGSIPSVVGGVDVSNLTATADGNLTRSSLSAGSANCGWCNLNGTNIIVELKTGSTGWCVGTIMIPLNW